MSVQKMVLVFMERILPPKERPDLFWTSVLTVVLAALNLIMICYFLFSNTFLQRF